MSTLIRFLLLAVLFALLLPGCKSMSEREDARKLEVTLDQYATAVRWLPLDRLYGFLEPELQPEEIPADLNRFRVTGYEVSGPPRMLAKDRVAQTAVIEYVLVETQVVRQLIDQQLWTRNDKGEWLRANSIPDFK